jgi:hypothetical protein
MPISIDEVKKYPQKTDEQRVREILEDEFGKSLPKKRISLGNLTHEFDLCSKDREIIGEIKSGKDLTPSGKKIKSYRFAEICLDCLYLMSVECKRKIMVLTNKEMYQVFRWMIEGLSIENVETRLVELDNPQFGR